MHGEEKSTIKGYVLWQGTHHQQLSLKDSEQSSDLVLLETAGSFGGESAVAPGYDGPPRILRRVRSSRNRRSGGEGAKNTRVKQEHMVRSVFIV